MTNEEKIKTLSFNLREKQVPYFDGEEMQSLLNKHNGDVDAASYEGLLLKAETTGLNVSGLTTLDSSSYFKMLASHYVTTNSGVLET